MAPGAQPRAPTPPAPPLPPIIAQLPVGALLVGTVVRGPSGAEAVLVTPLGSLLIESGLEAVASQKIAVEIVAFAARIDATLLPVATGRPQPDSLPQSPSVPTILILQEEVVLPAIDAATGKSRSEAPAPAPATRTPATPAVSTSTSLTPAALARHAVVQIEAGPDNVVTLTLPDHTEMRFTILAGPKIAPGLSQAARIDGVAPRLVVVQADRRRFDRSPLTLAPLPQPANRDLPTPAALPVLRPGHAIKAEILASVAAPGRDKVKADSAVMPMPRPGALALTVVAGTPVAAVEALAAPTRKAAKAAAVQTFQVLGHDSAGRLIVARQNLILRLEATAPLPAGTTLPLELFPLPERLPPALPAPWQDGRWPALEATLQALARDGAGAANQILRTVVPNPAPTSSANLIAFLFGLARKDVSAWIGEPITGALSRIGRRDLVERLRDDLGRVSDAANQALPGDWRCQVVPFIDGGQILPLRFYMRQQADDPERGSRTKPATRLIVDLELSQLGRLQIDGRYDAPRFDMILRSAAPLPQAMCNDIVTLFTLTTAAFDLAGGIGFQVGAAFIDLPAASAPNASRLFA